MSPWVLCCFVLSVFTSLSYAVNDVLVLPKASQLAAKTNDFSATLTWQLPSEHHYTTALIYRKAYALPIRRKNQSNSGVDLGQLVAELDIKQQRFGDAQLQKKTRYYYRVILQDKDGNQSLPSKPAIASLKDLEAPIKVATVKAKIIDAMHFNLRWSASASDDVQSYRVLRSRQNERPVIVKSVAISDASQPIYNTRITQRKNIALTYGYAIAAVDAAGNVSDPSPYVYIRLADKKAPRSPILLNATQQDGSLLLSWKENSEDDLKGYNVYRKNDKSDASFIKLNKTILNENRFIDETIEALSDYRYRVTALDDFANESKTTKGLPFRTGQITQFLEVPNNVQMKVSDKGLPQLSWKISPSKNKALKSSVFRSEGGPFKMISALLSEHSFIDNSVQQGKAYQYLVKSVTSLGEFSEGSKKVLWMGEKQ